jgi:hypothetical protein
MKVRSIGLKGNEIIATCPMEREQGYARAIWEHSGRANGNKPKYPRKK